MASIFETRKKTSMAAILLLLGLLFVIWVYFDAAARSVGVCYGQIANDLPPRAEVIDLYKANGIERMRIYNPNSETLEALRGSNIELIIGVYNDDAQNLANNAAAANDWVQTNIKAYLPDVKFRYITVGNEIKPNDPMAPYVLPAMQNIRASIASEEIKVSTVIEMSLLGSSFPPSNGSFSDVATSYINPIVAFLATTGAPLFANVYPYFSYISNTKDINLTYALFTSPGVVVRDGNLEYKNLFAASVDALYFALEKVGGADVSVIVSESGWPSAGGVAATVENARTYYSNLISNSKNGTPKRPEYLETYLFAMFDENQKGPEETERNFGLFFPNKQPKYQLTSFA
ncbi:glucan endo-1,3-beta-glucosidase-like [Corylus avellana]|uniref:glucan endo-1,3-beta-glucosidase-like n=1 Tax=Corylus avellana TaxID=13451 RepID=UPI00286C6DBD|nr:glucan endo-1,3-beta-glucosidase-like [Corylus avellana]